MTKDVSLSGLCAVLCSLTVGLGCSPDFAGSGRATAPDAGDGSSGAQNGTLITASIAAEVAEHSDSAVVGPEGGELVLSDGLGVEIPAGALDTTVEITLRDDPAVPPEVLEAAPENYTRLIELTPDGLAFAEPATLTVPLPPVSDPDLEVAIVYLHTPDGWIAESTVARDGDVLRVPISHFSVRLVGANCPGAVATELESWQLSGSDLCKTSYLLPCDALDAPSFFDGPLDGTGGALHVLNSPETLANLVGVRPQFGAAEFASGAILYRNPVGSSTESVVRARINPHHLQWNRNGAWKLGVLLKAGSRRLNYRLRAVTKTSVNSACAGVMAAGEFLENQEPNQSGSLAPGNIVVLAEDTRATTVAPGVVFAQMLGLELTGSGRNEAELIEVAIPPSATFPTNAAAVNALGVACFGQKCGDWNPKTQRCACWSAKHHRGHFPSADRQATWTYRTTEGPRAVILGQDELDCPCGGGRFYAAAGSQEQGTDATARNGCTGWETPICAGSSVTSVSDTTRKNPATYGVVHRFTVHLENPQAFVEEVDLAINFRGGAAVAAVRIDGDEPLGLAPPGGLDRAWVLKRFTLGSASTEDHEVELVIAGAGAGPLWLTLLPHRLVSPAADAVQIVRTDDSLVTDRDEVPPLVKEFRVRLNYPVGREVPAGAVRFVREDTGEEIDAIVRLAIDGDAPGLGPCEENETPSDPFVFCDRGQLQPIRRAKILRVFPPSALAPAQHYRMEIGGAGRALPDLLGNSTSAEDGVVPGASADDPSSRTIWKWRFSTSFDFRLLVISTSGMASRECYGSYWTGCCDTCSTCGQVPFLVTVDAFGADVDPTMQASWTCTPLAGLCSIGGHTVERATAWYRFSPALPDCIPASGSFTVSLTLGSGTAAVTHTTSSIDATCMHTTMCL